MKLAPRKVITMLDSGRCSPEATMRGDQSLGHPPRVCGWQAGVCQAWSLLPPAVSTGLRGLPGGGCSPFGPPLTFHPLSRGPKHRPSPPQRWLSRPWITPYPKDSQTQGSATSQPPQPSGPSATSISACLVFFFFLLSKNNLKERKK